MVSNFTEEPEPQNLIKWQRNQLSPEKESANV